MANLFAAIEARRRIGLDRFIYGLGIRHIGETTAVVLARGYGTAEAFLAAMDKVAERDPEAMAELDALDQVGTAVIEAAAAYFAEDHNRRIVQNLVAQLDIQDAEKPKTDTAVAGKTVVFTGALEKLTRDEAKAQAEALGGQGGVLGVEEDRHRRGGAGGGVQAEDGGGAGGAGDDGGGVVGAGGVGAVYPRKGRDAPDADIRLTSV